MKVFVSYSFIDSELHLLTLLLDKLRSGGHYVESSQENSRMLLNNIEQKMRSRDLFLGIITNNSNSISQVVREWEVARRNGIKSILLVEVGVKVDDVNVDFIRFNRHNSKPAINKLFGKVRANSNRGSESIGDSLIGAGMVIAGVAALIALLSGGDKK